MFFPDEIVGQKVIWDSHLSSQAVEVHFSTHRKQIKAANTPADEISSISLNNFKIGTEN